MTRTATTVLDAPPEQVFGYLAEIRNLPRWATEFAREARFEAGRARIRNGLGEFLFEIRADPATGVIDMLAGPDEESLWLFPTRVVPVGGGRSAFVFTMLQAPGQPDDLFESQYASLRRELENVRREVER